MAYKRNFKVGDYFTLSKTDRNIIYEVVDIPNNEYIRVKIIHPKDLANSLQHEGIFTVNLPKKGYHILGNIKKNKMLRLLYK